MTRIILTSLAIAVVMVVGSSVANAQSASSGSMSGASANSGSLSGASAGATINIGTPGSGVGATGAGTVGTLGNGGLGTNGAASGSGVISGGAATGGTSYGSAQGQRQAFTYSPNTSNYSRVEAPDLGRTVPGLVLGGPTGGANNCTVSAGVGGVGSGWGFGFNSAWESRECRVQEALRIASGTMNPADQAAQHVLKATMCQSAIYWDAYEIASRESGNARLACANERPKRGEVKMRNAEPAKPRATTSRGVATAAPPSDYATRVSACVNAPVGQYGACMARAKRGG